MGTIRNQFVKSLLERVDILDIMISVIQQEAGQFSKKEFVFSSSVQYCMYTFSSRVHFFTEMIVVHNSVPGYNGKSGTSSDVMHTKKVQCCVLYIHTT
jgi:hypothetical protein